MPNMGQKVVSKPSMQVVEQVAEIKGVDTTELSPLFKTINSDALDALVESQPAAEDGLQAVVFRYEGCLVHVHGDGRIEIDSV
jgi:hypothetical protein